VPIFSPMVLAPLTFAPVAPRMPRTLDEAAVRRREHRGILCRPPVLHVSRRPEFAPLVVEAVADLVADHRADGAIVHRGIGVGSKNALQNCRRDTISLFEGL